MENLFYSIAKEVSRCNLSNSSIPTKASISEADEAAMQEFAQNAIDVVNTMGYRFLTPIINTAIQKSAEFVIGPTSKFPNRSARGIITNEGFVIMHNSSSAEEFKTASSDSLRVKWGELRRLGIVEHDKFVKDYLATSPSVAAAMVLGRNANGLTEWKTQSGITLKEYLKQIEAK